MAVFLLREAFLYRNEVTSIYSLFDRGLMINPPFRVSYSVTSIMSQRSIFNQSLGKIFYEAIRERFLTNQSTWVTPELSDVSEFGEITEGLDWSFPLEPHM